MDNDRHSRSRLAGYDPERLFKATALVVGAGALGQNVMLDLALAGMGRIVVVDYDRFEDHNMTRSPLYPSPETLAEFGDAKAPGVAKEVAHKMTAPNPVAEFCVAFIQDVADELISKASLVFCAVDNARARAFLTDRARIIGRPVIEGGFHAEAINASVFDPMPSSPCYQCLSPGLEGIASCGQYGARAETENIIPAIQNSATVLGGLMAEQGLDWLHGRRHLDGRRLFFDIRTLRSCLVTLSLNPGCPGVHHALEDHHALSSGADSDVMDLLDEIRERIGPADVILPSLVVGTLACTSCSLLCTAWEPDWKWYRDPRCTECGGRYPRAEHGDVAVTVPQLSTEGNADVGPLRCRDLGLGSMSALEVWPHSGSALLCQLAQGPGHTTAISRARS